MKKILTFAVILSLSLGLMACGGSKSTSAPTSSGSTDKGEVKEESGTDTEKEETATDTEKEEVSATSGPSKTASASTGETVKATINIKDYGTIVVELYPGEAPITVENFVQLAKDGFYDGLTFHRIIAGFMMQGGDPLGNGTGGSDKNIKGEFAINGVENNISHTRGAISMARSADPDSASSQFFIVHEDSTFLDGQYAAFGYVTEGIDVVDAVCEAAKPTDGNGSIAPSAQPIIESVTIY